MYPNDPERNSTRRFDNGQQYRDPNTAYSQSGYNDGYGNRDNYQQDYYRDERDRNYRDERPRHQGPQVAIGTFIGGVLATAVVTALSAWLVAWIIRLIFERVNETGKLGVWNPMAQDEYWFAVVGVVCAIAAGALWYVLLLTTPSPGQFYSWIVGLLIIASVLIPLLLSREFSTGITTAIMHLVIGLPVLALVRTMGEKSRIR